MFQELAKMESPNITPTDGISRIMGLGALLIAIGSVIFFYQENQRLKAEVSELKPGAENPEQLNEFISTWDSKLVNALTEFDKQSNEAIDKFDKAREARNRLVRAAEEIPALSRSDVEELISQQLAQISVASTPAPSPDLMLVQTSLRPIDGEDNENRLRRIRNAGTVNAEILMAQFKPRKGSEFEVEPGTETTGDRVVVEFRPEHHVGERSDGSHRLYERNYRLPEIVIPTDSTVPIDIEVRANNRHLDWGMRGDLLLEYQGGRTLRIENIRAVFVPDPEETT